MIQPIHPTKLSRRSFVALCLAIVLATSLPAVADATTTTDSATPMATFEGEEIDLTMGWGEAKACLVSETGVECFRTVPELDEKEKLLVGLSSATCSTSLRLYDGTYRTGSVLALATRGVWLNLNIYGFDNLTSSFKVGSCGIELASSTSGAGSRYKSCLYAYCLENVMDSGWNNVVSSVYNK